MQDTHFQNHALPSQKCKRKEISTGYLNENFQMNVLHGLQNARNIVASLERSIEKSSSYEDKLLRCRASHKHVHDFNDWSWGTDFFDDKDTKSTKTDSGISTSIHIQNPVGLLESWSTMSILCLQFQYEELSKRYEALLNSFNDKCSVISVKNSTLTRLRQRARIMHAQLASAHRSLLCVGEKYLTLKKRRNEQLQQYDKNIKFLKGRVREVLTTAERARMHLDYKLSRAMALEKDSEYAMLLSEMRKCNHLYLENLKLKAQLEECMPGLVHGSK